jgi:hypothetical protein
MGNIGIEKEIEELEDRETVKREYKKQKRRDENERKREKEEAIAKEAKKTPAERKAEEELRQKEKDKARARYVVAMAEESRRKDEVRKARYAQEPTSGWRGQVLAGFDKQSKLPKKPNLKILLNAKQLKNMRKAIRVVKEYCNGIDEQDVVNIANKWRVDAIILKEFWNFYKKNKKKLNPSFVVSPRSRASTLSAKHSQSPQKDTRHASLPCRKGRP